MKYKVLIMLVLMIGGLSLLSCNQLGKRQQVEDANTDEESVTEEKWDSTVITYKRYEEFNFSETCSLIMYSDGTAKHGHRADHGYSSNRIYWNYGYWNYGSFYRGGSEFGYINITIGNSDYYISENKDMIWETTRYRDGFKDMVSNNREHGDKIRAWDVYYQRVETSQPKTRNDMRTDGQDHQESGDACDDTFFCQQIHKWNDMHHQGRFEDSSNNPYAETVMFYGKRMKGKEVVKMKQDALRDRSSDYRQECYNINVMKLSDNRVRCDFGKRVTKNGKTKDYPSYLYFSKIGNYWLIDEESDEITDRNLRK